MNIKAFIIALVVFGLQNSALAEGVDVALNALSAAPEGRELKNVGAMRTARITFYNPDSHTAMEGGPRNRYSEPINSIEDAIKNGRPVTVAADIYGAFGNACNQRDNRCLLLIHAAGFDMAFPSYRKKFPNLPRNSFIALVEDTGSDFFHTAGKRFDVAVRSRRLAVAIPPYLNAHIKWMRLHSPCGSDERARRCQLADARISGEARSAMGLSGRDL